jgi:surface protein
MSTTPAQSQHNNNNFFNTNFENIINCIDSTLNDDQFSILLPLTDLTIRTAIKLWFGTAEDKELCIKIHGHISDWNTSCVSNMSQLFYAKSDFNEDISKWNVEHVTNFKEMFFYCTIYNQPLNDWNVSNATDMSNMFDHCTLFNKPLDKWCTDKVETMSFMFNGCTNFNQPLNSWKTCSVKNMKYLFAGCKTFNQLLDMWDVSSVESMECMFFKCYEFNQSLTNWNITPKLKFNKYMFHDCLKLDDSQKEFINNICHMQIQTTQCSSQELQNAK